MPRSSEHYSSNSVGSLAIIGVTCTSKHSSHTYRHCTPRQSIHQSIHPPPPQLVNNHPCIDRGLHSTSNTHVRWSSLQAELRHGRLCTASRTRNDGRGRGRRNTCLAAARINDHHLLLYKHKHTYTHMAVSCESVPVAREGRDRWSIARTMLRHHPLASNVHGSQLSRHRNQATKQQQTHSIKYREHIAIAVRVWCLPRGTKANAKISRYFLPSFLPSFLPHVAPNKQQPSIARSEFNPIHQSRISNDHLYNEWWVCIQYSNLGATRGGGS